ncbi:MAG TPA: hypothetical protein VGK49_12845, partial [Ilumatobacteraceae bacterium]
MDERDDTPESDEPAAFKSDGNDADDDTVDESRSTGGRPRITWDPVTDGSAVRDTGTEGSAFTFNLGEALARVQGGDVAPAPAPAPAAPVAPREPLPATASSNAPDPDVLPTIQEATGFPGLSPSGQITPSDLTPPRGATLPAAAAPSLPSATPMLADSGTESLERTSSVALLELPVLGTAPAAAPPPMAPPPSAAPLPGVAPRPASSAARRKRKSRVLPRFLLVVVVLGGLVAAALVFGRQYLFPSEWEKELLPTVETLQDTTGTEFDEPVNIRILDEATYGAQLLEAEFGQDWVSQVPRWRALGLATGEPTVDSAAAVAGDWWPARYDVITGEGARIETLSGQQLDDALAETLAVALFDQTFGTRASDRPAAEGADDATAAGTTAADVPGFGSTDVAARAVIDHQAGLTSGTDAPSTGRARLNQLPTPIAYHLLAIEELGQPLLNRLGVSPTPGNPEQIAAVLGDAGSALAPAPRAAGEPQLIEGDVVDGDGVA